jgi:S1-C subfamily serine protease
VVTIGQDGRGTGVVIAPGKVLTNAHNLRDRTTSVTFADGRTEQATLAGADGDGDLVVVDVDTASAPAATWAEISPQPGDVVFAVSRGGHRQRISFGMVTTADLAFHGPRGRTIEGGVEHTAALPRGSSGGPLVNAAGAVVGINTHRVGRGFYVARPVDAALKATIDGLAAGKSVTRPHLGVALAPPEVAAKLRASVGLPERDGLLVRAVEPDSPAAKAGLAEGDLLVAVNGVALTSLATLYNALKTDTETIELTVVRGAEERTVVVAFTADEATGTGS